MFMLVWDDREGEGLNMQQGNHFMGTAGSIDSGCLSAAALYEEEHLR